MQDGKGKYHVIRGYAVRHWGQYYTEICRIEFEPKVTYLK